MTCCGQRNQATRIEYNNLHDKDGGFRYVSILRTRSDTTLCFPVSVRCKDTTEKIELVRYDPKARKHLDLARDHEIAQLRSVVSSLAWVSKAMQALAFIRRDQATVRMRNCLTS